jgi:1-acyl-sn-glycerol-3-phosphate acyltransferase
MSKTKTPKHLLKHSWTWQLFSVYVMFIHRLFYKSIIVEGKEKIPESGPVIYAPNHQNALMDPMLVLHATGKQIVFLARADIFSNSFLASIFRWLKILPVYRIRDGKNNLAKNDESFDMIADVLEHKMPVGIFPEAAHSNKRRLLNLKKGIPRVAFLCEERNNFELGITIIPVGIYYSKYNTFRSIAHVRFGKPIKASDYREIYEENDQKGIIALRDKLHAELRPLVIDIRNLELYDIYESLRALYVKQLIKKFQLGKLTQINKFRADKITINALDNFAESEPEKMEELSAKVLQYNELKNKYKISNQSIEKPKLNLLRLLISSLLILVLSPIFIYGLFNNIIAYLIPKLLVTKIKDRQFHSSIKFVWGIFVIPIIYLIQFFVFYGIFHSWSLALIYLLTLPISGFAAQAWFEWTTIILHDWRKLRVRKMCPAEYLKIKNTHNFIVNILDSIVAKENI